MLDIPADNGAAAPNGPAAPRVTHHVEANGIVQHRTVQPRSRNIFAFVKLLFATAQRIAVSLLVQSVAATAVANQALRTDRVLALLAVAVFFIFLQSGASAINSPIPIG